MVRIMYGFGVKVRLMVRTNFRFISQTAYLIYRYLVDGAEYKSHLRKNLQSLVSLGPTKHRLLINNSYL